MVIDWLKSILMGVFQGLTEFLPVSSSGHVMLLNELLGVDLDGDALRLFTVLLHVGTLIAVLFVYRNQVWDMLCHPIKSDFKWLVVATVPTVVFMLVLKAIDCDFILEGETARRILPWAFLTTAVLLCLADSFTRYRSAAKTTHKHVRLTDALAMGLMQCLGTFTGVSRSGSTITGGLASGLNRNRAAEFSFLMSIPAIFGAAVLDLYGLLKGEASAASVEAITNSVPQVIVGVIAAAVAGFVAIKFMLYLIRKVRLKWFAVYVGLLGAVLLVNDYLIKIW